MSDYQEFFIYCQKCEDVTHWAFIENGCIAGECMDCEHMRDFDTWDEVIALSHSD
jgi:hypothetical protein